MSSSFNRAEMILGAKAMEKLWQSRVAVVGLGGVGSWCAEALVRSGIGSITLVDCDTVSETNINRQSIASVSTVGMEKPRAAALRLRDISPRAEIRELPLLYNAENREALFSEKYDFIVDAIDLVSCKTDLIQSAVERSIPIISALGTGNKLDASLLTICDISKTSGCPLARVVRKELRARGINHHTVVFSPEQGVKPEQTEAPPPGRRSVPGSLVWVTATAGMLLAQHVITEIAKKADF